MRKLSIENTWNQLIFERFNKKVKIDENEIYQKIENSIKNNLNQKSFNLSEIVFTGKNKESLQKKYEQISSDIKSLGFDQAAIIHSMSETSKKGGEIFVPKIPSVKIVDLAKAIVPNRKHKIIGVRPGEKIAEVLITKDESKNTLVFTNHYVINSEIFGNHNKNKYKLKDFEYNSLMNKHFLNEKQIKKICENLKLI